MSEEQRCTLGGMDPNDPAHRELKSNGQQRDYVILCDEEREKGFVRPVRFSYRHVGSPAWEYPLRDLTPEEHERYDQYGYVKFEAYPESDSSVTGRFWTQEDLDKIGKGCGTVTRMGTKLAETYARDPKFYGGTFCCGCGAHFPIGKDGEFVWNGTNERVGI